MFKKEILEFSFNLESLREFVELVDTHLKDKSLEEMKEDPMSFAPLILVMNKTHPEKFPLKEEIKSKLINSLSGELEVTSEKSNEDRTTFTLNVNNNDSSKIKASMDKISKKQKRSSSLYQSALISVISYVEWFLAQLIHSYYRSNPNAIGIKDKQLSLNDLFELGSIDDAKKYLIDSKVESIMRSSLDDWIKFLKEQVGLSMGYIKESKPALIEACQRRNLYVHNGGVINSIYIKNCGFSNEEYSIGSQLDSDSDYIEATISAFERSFILIAAELWKKNEPSNEDRFTILHKILYSHICNGRYEIAASLACFLYNDKKQKESKLLMAKVNYWQAIKWNGGFEDIKEEIENTDFSAKDEIYLLSKHVLLDQFEEACDLLPFLIKHNKLSLDNVSDQPIFKELIKQDIYIEKFLKN